MTKALKQPWKRFTKAELIKTIKALDKRQTQLLNQLAKLRAEVQEPAVTPLPIVSPMDVRTVTVLDAIPDSPPLSGVAKSAFPWSTSAALPVPSPLDTEDKS